MLNWTVWRNAAEQMFFSLSVSWGGLITFGSYNKFKNPVHHQALAIRDGWAPSGGHIPGDFSRCFGGAAAHVSGDAESHCFVCRRT